ncbi:hypothetical protein [Actinocorallia sp. A-T 12471]|uniref:hypothetical protein n=1 Tax=Actinocorallia sp. A-T 12471 TaxID=3089813 RepID=UPI0029D0D20B|nr:hypothetical protein [Actinocorallia sp. A-T 12471]MDX6742582.1 hypothetical protein [Actinocorallia sp. A-T 12471]
MSFSGCHVLSRALEEHVDPDGHPGLQIITDSGPLHLTAHEARDAVRARDGDVALRAAVWRAVILTARNEHADDRTRLFALWLADPWLRRTLTLVRTLLGVTHEDFEAEFTVSFLEALSVIDEEPPDLGDRLLRAASAPVWRAAQKLSKWIEFQLPSDLPFADGLDIPSADLWELEIQPPFGGDRLSASLRVVGSATEVEGIRVGALASRMGLSEFVYRARRPAKGVRVGTLRLRPAGAAR